MGDIITTLRHNTTGIEVVRLLVSVLALCYTTAATTKAARYYHNRMDVLPDAIGTPEEDTDFLLLDLRLEIIVTATAAFLVLSSAIACFLPPPQGHGPNSLATFTTNAAASCLGVLILAIKIANRRVRVRVYERIDAYLSGMSIERAREMTADERHALKGQVATYKGAYQLLLRQLREAGLTPVYEVEPDGGTP